MSTQSSTQSDTGPAPAVTQAESPTKKRKKSGSAKPAAKPAAQPATNKCAPTAKKPAQQKLTFTAPRPRFGPQLRPWSCRRRIEAHIRLARPVRVDYELGTGLQNTRVRSQGLAFDTRAIDQYTAPANVAFIHDEVGKFLEAFNFGHLEARFKDMGILTHDDLVNISVDIRLNQRLRQEFKVGLELGDASWLPMKRELYRYARPRPIADL